MLTALCFLLLFMLLASFVMSIVALFWIGDVAETVSQGGPIRGGGYRNAPATFRVTPATREIAPGCYSLGTGVCPGRHERVEGYAFAIFADETRSTRARRPQPRLRGDEESKNASVTDCAVPFAEGARWKTPLKFAVDPSQSDGIPRDFAVESFYKAVREWDSHLEQQVAGTQDVVNCCDGLDQNSPDGKNELCFGFIDIPNALAVTVRPVQIQCGAP